MDPHLVARFSRLLLLVVSIRISSFMIPFCHQGDEWSQEAIHSFSDVVFGASEVVVYKRTKTDRMDGLYVALQTKRRGDQAYQDVGEYLTMKG